MTGRLEGKRVALLVASSGVEEVGAHDVGLTVSGASAGDHDTFV